jgi:hypothetical protein
MRRLVRGPQRSPWFRALDQLRSGPRLVVLAVGLAVLALAAALAIGTAPSTRDAEPIKPGTASDQVLEDVYVTGYTWFDNTPRGSALISHPERHRTAGGVGSFDDPVTVAVGHQLVDGRDVLDLPAGTLLYLPHLQRYGIVEDTCGDGPRPQDVACHDLGRAPKGARLWLDVYVGGSADEDAGAAAECARQITDSGGRALREIVVNPGPDRRVTPGPIFVGGKCRGSG